MSEDEIDKQIGRLKKKKEELTKKLEAQLERDEQFRRSMKELPGSHPEKDTTVQFDEEEEIEGYDEEEEFEEDEFLDLQGEDEGF